MTFLANVFIVSDERKTAVLLQIRCVTAQMLDTPILRGVRIIRTPEQKNVIFGTQLVSLSVYNGPWRPIGL
jgi:hypothetical protein